MRALGVIAVVAGAKPSGARAKPVLLLCGAASAAFALAPLASAGVKNACVLVTATDASSALKGKVANGTHLNVGGFNTCIYTLGKVTVTVKTRLLSHAAYAKVVRAIPGTALKASNISNDAWVFFVPDGSALDDWKQGNELGFIVVGADGNANLIIQQLAKAARSRV